MRITGKSTTGIAVAVNDFTWVITRDYNEEKYDYVAHKYIRKTEKRNFKVIHMRFDLTPVLDPNSAPTIRVMVTGHWALKNESSKWFKAQDSKYLTIDELPSNIVRPVMLEIAKQVAQVREAYRISGEIALNTIGIDVDVDSLRETAQEDIDEYV
jgi:hypothetical protein